MYAIEPDGTYLGVHFPDTIATKMRAPQCDGQAFIWGL